MIPGTRVRIVAGAYRGSTATVAGPDDLPAAMLAFIPAGTVPLRLDPDACFVALLAERLEEMVPS